MWLQAGIPWDCLSSLVPEDTHCRGCVWCAKVSKRCSKVPLLVSANIRTPVRSIGSNTSRSWNIAAVQLDVHHLYGASADAEKAFMDAASALPDRERSRL